MPYIKFDLDAMKRVPMVARLAEVSEGAAGWGLVQLWRHCWEMGEDVVSFAVLQGIFGGAGSNVAMALTAFDFAEPQAEGWVRVRGASDYLRITEAKSKGGKARQAQIRTAREAAREAAYAPAHAPAAAPAQSSSSTYSPTHPLTQHPSTRSIAGSAEKPSPPADLFGEEAKQPPALGALAIAWNELTTAPLPRVQAVSKNRKAAAQRALVRRPLAEWREVFRRMNLSERLRNPVGIARFCDFDWAISPGGVKPEPATRVLEGYWDDQNSALQKPRREPMPVWQPDEQSGTNGVHK